MAYQILFVQIQSEFTILCNLSLILALVLLRPAGSYPSYDEGLKRNVFIKKYEFQ